MWKDVFGFEGLYIIDENGTIKSLPRNGTKGGVIKQYMKNNGYISVSLSKNGKRYTKDVHRLVYFSFYPSSDISLQVNHKDENTKNNKLENLELMSQIDNQNYGTRNKRISDTNRNISGTFQTRQSKKINCYLYPSMDFVKEFRSTKEVEMELGIYHSHVSKCCKNIYKQIQGYTFRYV